MEKSNADLFKANPGNLKTAVQEIDMDELD